ncbi:TPA: tryptophan-rich sensory protein [Candidatus Nomurabacteria bacterium]|nr:tryptophan-rich sensory protein [Candidatus Nomurabacteria bacterium]
MNTTQIWYASLIRPEWAPPAWVFGPAWTFLYTLIAISFGYIFYKYNRGEINWKFALPFALNLIFNFLFSPIQFVLQNNILATLDILLVLVTLIWLIKISWKKYLWVAVVNLPYLAWVSFATVLQITITYLNW